MPSADGRTETTSAYNAPSVEPNPWLSARIAHRASHWVVEPKGEPVPKLISSDILGSRPLTTRILDDQPKEAPSVFGLNCLPHSFYRFSYRAARCFQFAVLPLAIASSAILNALSVTFAMLLS